MNNLLVRTNQIDGEVVGYQSAQNLIRQINVVNAYHVGWLKEYIEDAMKELLDPVDVTRIKGTIFNITLGHHLKNYFGPKAVPCALGLLRSDRDRQKARAYYCNEKNYRFFNLDGNVFNGKSCWKAPCMVFELKFIEEILGFKNTPEDVYKYRHLTDKGKPVKLTKAYKKEAPVVGFNNSFQPEDYALAPNKLTYMRNLTIVQKIVALQWMCLGDRAFRDDLSPMEDQAKQEKKLKKKAKNREKKAAKKVKRRPVGKLITRTIRRKATPGELEGLLSRSRIAEPAPGRALTTNYYQANKMSQRDFRSLALAYRCDVLFEMVGGSRCGRSNRKLPVTGITTRSEFMAASLNQQTLWLYRKMMRDDNDDDDASGTNLFKKHLGKYYRVQGRAKPITKITQLRRGRVTEQTRYLGRYAQKLDRRIDKNARLVKRAKTEIRKIKRKVTVDAVKNKKRLDRKIRQITKKLKTGKVKPGTIVKNAGGIFSKYGMIGALIISSSALVLATSATVTAAVALDKINDALTNARQFVAPAEARVGYLENMSKGVRKFLGDINYEVVGLGWEGFRNLAWRWLQVHKYGNKNATVPNTKIPFDELFRDYGTVFDEVNWEKRFIEQYYLDNQPPFNEDVLTLLTDLCEFRNRSEIVFLTLERYFAQQETRFVDPDGNPIEMAEIFARLDEARKRNEQAIADQRLVVDDQSRVIENLVRTVQAQAEDLGAARETNERQDAEIARLGAELESAGAVISGLQAEVGNLKSLVEAIMLKINYDELDERYGLKEVLEAVRIRVGALEEIVDGLSKGLEKMYDGFGREIFDLKEKMQIDHYHRGEEIDLILGKIEELKRATSDVFDRHEQQISGLGTEIDQLDSKFSQQVTSAANSAASAVRQVTAQQTSINQLTTEVNALKASSSQTCPHTSTIADHTNKLNLLHNWVRYVPNMYEICKKVVGEQFGLGITNVGQTDVNGNLIAPNPGNILSNRNDFIISVVPYDYRNTTSAIITGWTDRNGDSDINIVACRIAATTNSTTLVKQANVTMRVIYVRQQGTYNMSMAEKPLW